MEPIGTVEEIWRYPVKSMVGEKLTASEVTLQGLVGDRLWAVREEQHGTIVGGKKIPALMMCRARFLAEPLAEAVGNSVPHIAITLPDGAELRSDQPDVNARLSAFLDRSVVLCQKQPATNRTHYRGARLTLAEMRRGFGLGPNDPLPDLSMLPVSLLAELARYATPPGTYFDAYALHLLTTSSLAHLRTFAPEADVEIARFRPNVLVRTRAEGLAENHWCGGKLQLGEATTSVEVPTVRCSMPTRAQPGLRADPSVLRAIAEQANRCFGVYAKPERPGRIRVGDLVQLERHQDSTVGRWIGFGATSLKRIALRAAAALTPNE